MDDRLILEQLEGVAEGLEIEVRYETLRKEARYNPGGLCRVRGTPVIIVNRKAPLQDQVLVLAAAVKRFDLSGIYLRPGLREFLEGVEPGGTVEIDEIADSSEEVDGDG